MDRVADWMTQPAITVEETSKLSTARERMRASGVRRLPVVNKDGTLVGIVTEGDVNRISDSPETDVREFNLYHTAGALPVRDFMCRDVMTVAHSAPLSEVAHILRLHKIGGLPVVDGVVLVGVISESDLFRALEQGTDHDITTFSSRHQQPVSDQ